MSSLSFDPAVNLDPTPLPSLVAFAMMTGTLEWQPDDHVVPGTRQQAGRWTRSTASSRPGKARPGECSSSTDTDDLGPGSRT
jgi:hypothetical protein